MSSEQDVNAEREAMVLSVGLGARLIVPLLVVLAVVLVAVRPVLVAALGPSLQALEVGFAAFVAAGFQFRAALGFGRGEYLRRAYAVSGLTYVIALLHVLSPHTTTPTGHLVSAAATLVNNIVFVTGVALFSRAFASAGLDLPGSRLRRVGVTVLFGLGGAALGAVRVGRAGLALAHGDLAQLNTIISFAGDLTIFTLTGPLFLTALALRGGLLVWPWAFFTASSFCWILSDANGLMDTLVGGQVPDSAQHWMNLWPVFACLFAAAAAHVQRIIVPGRRPPNVD